MAVWLKAPSGPKARASKVAFAPSNRGKEGTEFIEAPNSV
jgi:hypothetical protein